MWLMVIVGMLIAGCEPSVSELKSAGIAEYQLGNNQQARQVLQQVLERKPFDPDALYYMGRIVHDEGFQEQAIYYYQCCIDADPSYTAAQEWLTKAQEEIGQIGQVLQFIP